MVKSIVNMNFIFLTLMLLNNISCQNKNTVEVEENMPSTVIVDNSYKLPNIDLNHWKVTLPIGNPTEVEPPEILNYATNATLKPFMYNSITNQYGI